MRDIFIALKKEQLQSGEIIIVNGQALVVKEIKLDESSSIRSLTLVDPSEFFHKFDFIDNCPLDYLDISVRAYNVLAHNNIKTFQQLLSLSYRDLRKLYNMGERTAMELLKYVASQGYQLRNDEG